MSIPDRKPNVYAVTAYNSEQLPPLQLKDVPKNKPPMFGRFLSFGHADINTVPKYIFENSDIEGICEEERKTDEELIADCKKNHITIDTCWNHRCIRYDTLNIWTILIIKLLLLSKLCIPISFFTGLFTSIISQIISDAGLVDEIEFILLITGVPLSIYVVCWLITRLPSRWWLKASKGAQWELNRETGMVTIYDYNSPEYKKTGRPVAFTKPFTEFEAILYQLPNRHGGTQDALLLRHRHSQMVINFACFSQGIREREWIHFWHFIQNYMDISKPLPDIPDFERYREFDPVTKSHDLQAGRKPRYWRDMNQDEYEDMIENPDMYPNVDPYAFPCIIQEHVWLEAIIKNK